MHNFTQVLVAVYVPNRVTYEVSWLLENCLRGLGFHQVLRQSFHLSCDSYLSVQKETMLLGKVEVILRGQTFILLTSPGRARKSEERMESDQETGKDKQVILAHPSLHRMPLRRRFWTAINKRTEPLTKPTPNQHSEEYELCFRLSPLCDVSDNFTQYTNTLVGNSRLDRFD